MNKQLEQIYREAFGHGPRPIGEPELERFAELIIRECAEVCMQRSRDAIALRADRENSAKAILEHWGIDQSQSGV